MDFTTAKSYLNELAMNHVANAAKLTPVVEKAPEPEPGIPVISNTTCQIFESLKSTKEKAPILRTNMREKVKTLEDTKSELRDAKNPISRNNIYNFLYSALHVAAIATTILGIIGMVTEGAIVVGVGAAIAMTFGGFLSAYAIGNIIEAYSASHDKFSKCTSESAQAIYVFSNAIIGFAYPIRDAFAKVDNLEESIVKQKADIAQNHIGLVKFFKEKEFPEIEAELQAHINASEEALEKLNPRLDAAYGLQKIIEDNKQALKELEKAFAFYK